MLKRQNLVPLRSEFGRITRQAKTYDSPSFRLLVSYQQTADIRQQATGAFIVSKKIDKRSVVRHDVKRKLSDAVATVLPRLGKNIELIFLANQKAINSTRDELKKEVELVLHRARLIPS